MATAVAARDDRDAPGARAAGTAYDTLVVGGGIAGMESAIELGDMGYRVLLVEKEASIGGKMVLLSKVFPTLDCASCISTPKMAAVAHHPNVEVVTNAQVERVTPAEGGGFRARIRRHPTFVDAALCTGCRSCEPVCPVAVPDAFNAGLVSRRAAHIPFPQAVPLKAVIDRAGSSPCSFQCPAGIPAHGYVALVRSGRYEEAFQLVLDATPLVGSLGRACYATCEDACTRARLEGPVPIRRLKRFVADRHYGRDTTPAVAVPSGDGVPARAVPSGDGGRVAIVGSGPAGLTAAWQLARAGHRVTILEAAAEPGGMLRSAIPGYRLPVEVVERDIANVTAIGVRIETGVRVEHPGGLLSDGYDAVLVATGTPLSTRLGIPGEDLAGVRDALMFLAATRRGDPPDLRGRVVVVVGGGDVAMDAARTARRLGAAEVVVAYRRGREQMPAHPGELAAAEREGVRFALQAAPVAVTGTGRVRGLRCIRTVLGDSDGSGRRRPEPVPGSEFDLACDVVVAAVGMRADTASLAGEVPLDPAGTIAADRDTLETGVPFLFAAGDVVSGPSDIAHAVGQGRRAAAMIDRRLRGLPLDGAGFDEKLPPVTPEDVLARQRSHSRREPVAAAPCGTPDAPSGTPAVPCDFAELEPPLTEAEAGASAVRCLDCGVCAECRQCVTACPAGAIDLTMRGDDRDVQVGAVILAAGFEPFPAELKEQYGYGRFPNVVTAPQLERLLSPTRPYNTLLRPGDGRVPDRIAYVMCVGSRDDTVGNPACSTFCCMYSLKQAQLIAGVAPLADVTVHCMDLRAVGKGYEEFLADTTALGTTVIKGRVARVRESDGGNLLLRYEDVDGGGQVAEAEYDLVVLAVGVQPNRAIGGLFDGTLAVDDLAYVREPDAEVNPAATSIPGVYVAGAISGAKDIPESILHAGAAAAGAAAHLVEREGVAA